MTAILEFARANPLALLPVALLASVAIYAALKRLLKLVAILGITAAIWIVLLEYLTV